MLGGPHSLAIAAGMIWLELDILFGWLLTRPSSWPFSSIGAPFCCRSGERSDAISMLRCTMYAALIGGREDAAWWIHELRIVFFAGRDPSTFRYHA